MKWLISTFYLHPIPVVLLTLAAYVSVTIIYFGRISERAKAACPTGLSPVPLNQFLQYVNNCRSLHVESGFDGSKFGKPVIEGICTGPRREYIVSLFQFVLPTGRSGTWQTVVHIRSGTKTLPDVSLNDPTYGPKLSDLLRQKAEFRFKDSFVESEPEHNAGKNRGIVDQLQKIEGLVLDAGGHDLFFYVRGKTAEPAEWNGLIERGISLFEMIVSGDVDAALIQESQAERAYALFVGAKTMLLTIPGWVMIFLVGYGNKVLATGLVLALLLYFGIAKARYSKYKDAYPVKTQ